VHCGWSRLSVPFKDKENILFNRLYHIFLGQCEPLPFFVPLIEKRKSFQNVFCWGVGQPLLAQAMYKRVHRTSREVKWIFTSSFHF
jgi:hypothetical protein